MQPIFIFDKIILDNLEDKNDSRLEFIHRQIEEIQKQLVGMGATILTFYGIPLQVFKQLLTQHKIHEVYANHDYEPYALQRDAQVKQLLLENGVAFHTYKDQCIFEKDEVVKDDGKPYTIFYALHAKVEG